MRISFPTSEHRRGDIAEIARKQESTQETYGTIVVQSGENKVDRVANPLPNRSLLWGYYMIGTIMLDSGG